MPIVISLCDYSTNILQPWADAGYQCYAIDLLHKGIKQVGNITKIGADIRECISQWFPIGEEVLFSAAFPPCTHTATSGARHFISKGARKASEAFELIGRCQQLLNYWQAPYFLEQPVSTTSTYIGKPNFTFNPCDYAGYAPEPKLDAYTKKTCLWTGNGFIMPEPRPIEPVKVCKQGSWIQKLGKGDGQRRSLTPIGFSKAIFQANCIDTTWMN